MGRHTKRSHALEARRVRQRLAQINPSNSNPQRQSPLFSKIPPEIRNQIFEFSVSQDTHAITSTVSTRAPGIHTELLCTCRLIYYETNSIPMRSATIFCRHGFNETAINWFSQLTAKNVAEMNHVYGYMAYGYLMLQKLVNLPQFRPKHMTFSIPQYTWKLFLMGQDRSHMASFLPSDLGAGILPDSIETITYEFEVRPQDVEWLKTTIKKFAIGEQSLTRRDGRVFAPPGRDVVSYSPWELNFWDPPHTLENVSDLCAKVVFNLAPP